MRSASCVRGSRSSPYVVGHTSRERKGEEETPARDDQPEVPKWQSPEVPKWQSEDKEQ